MRAPPKLLAGRRALTVADVWRLLLPSFWWTPQGTPLLFVRQAAVVALMAFAGLGVKPQLRLLHEEILDEKRRMVARKYHYTWAMPMTKVAAHVVGRYRKQRPTTTSEVLFVTDEGKPLALDIMAKPFLRADKLLGNEVPLTTMLAKFFTDNVERRATDTEAMLAFVSRRLPVQRRPPAASMKDMVAMLDATDPMDDDLRPFENEAYAIEKIKALGGSNLPLCLWDLTKGRNLGRKFKGTLPDSHPIVKRLATLQLKKGKAGSADRDPIFEELMPEIDRLIFAGEMSAAQAADLFGLTEKGFGWKRSWWRKGGTEARKAAYAAGRKKSQAYPRPPLTHKQRAVLKALKQAAWPLPEGHSAFRQDLVDRYFREIAQMIADRNLKGYEAATLLSTKGTVISDLLADLKAGSPLIVHTVTDPEERERARKIVEAALVKRPRGETLAELTRRLRRDKKLRISSEFVRALNEMGIKRARSASRPTKPRRGRTLRRHGLTPAAVRALWDLDRKEGRSIGSLAADWGRDPSLASTVVEQLVKAGFAARHRDPSHWRRKLVSLTKAGEALKHDILRGAPARNAVTSGSKGGAATPAARKARAPATSAVNGASRFR